MKIVIAPNALKGSLSAYEAAKAMQQGAQQACNELCLTLNLELQPIADGGDGFAQVMGDALNLIQMQISVSGPLETPLNAPLYFNADHSIAVFDMTSISGLTLLSPQQRNPLLTTTLGIGETIKIALDYGAKKIIVGIGGSATNDGGIGMASALGVKFFNQAGNIVKPIGESLQHIVDIDSRAIDPRLKQAEITIACDVNNPFIGDDGAARIFAAQKGANPEQVEQLENGMRHYAQLINDTHDIDIRDTRGAGAAGGLAAALLVFCNATLSSGIDIILGQTNFDHALENASLVLTAEGRFDSQTNYGKAPAGVAKRAKEHNVPCIMLAGSVDVNSQQLTQTDFSAAYSLCSESVSEEKAMTEAYDCLVTVTEQVIREFVTTKTLPAFQ